MSDEINPNPTSAEGSSEVKPVDAESSGVAKTETPAEPIPAPEPIQTPESEPQTAQSVQIEPLAESSGQRGIWGDLIAKGREFIAGKKRKKLDKVMTMFDRKTKITNDEVEKLLHVSDATATRYLSILEKEGKIQQNGKTGKGVSYFKL